MGYFAAQASFRSSAPRCRLLCGLGHGPKQRATERGPNTIFVFELGGLRIAHFGDFGQAALRDEQAAAIGTVDLAFLPVGGGLTIDEQAAAIARRITARWVVPMHYRTRRIDFLEPADDFLGRMPGVHHPGTSAFDTDELPTADAALAVLPDAP